MPSSRYYIEFGGQFEHMIAARQRLMIVVPVALVLIFSLLYVTYGNIVDTRPSLHGDSVRVDRRHHRAVAARHAVFDLGGGRLRGPVGCGGSR